MAKSNLVKYTPMYDLRFTGAVSGKRYILKMFVPVELDPADVVHIDPADLREGVVEPPRRTIPELNK